MNTAYYSGDHQDLLGMVLWYFKVLHTLTIQLSAIVTCLPSPAMSNDCLMHSHHRHNIISI